MHHFHLVTMTTLMIAEKNVAGGNDEGKRKKAKTAATNGKSQTRNIGEKEIIHRQIQMNQEAHHRRRHHLLLPRNAVAVRSAITRKHKLVIEEDAMIEMAVIGRDREIIQRLQIALYYFNHKMNLSTSILLLMRSSRIVCLALIHHRVLHLLYLLLLSHLLLLLRLLLLLHLLMYLLLFLIMLH